MSYTILPAKEGVGGNLESFPCVAVLAELPYVTFSPEDEPPKLTAPPPVKPVPGVIVKEEFTNEAFAMLVKVLVVPSMLLLVST